MGAGDDDRSPTPQKELSDCLRQGHVRNPEVEHRLDLRIAARHGVADDDQVGGRVEMAGVEPLVGINSQALQQGAHRGINVGVGPGYPETLLREHPRQRRHCGAADGDEMDVSGWQQVHIVRYPLTR